MRGRGRRAADTRGPAAAAASEGGERAGVVGPQARPRARWGWLGQAARAFEAFSFFLFYFSFHLHCLNLNLVLVFEFKNWCTKFIRVLDM